MGLNTQLHANETQFVTQCIALPHITQSKLTELDD